MKSNIVPKASPDALPELAAFLEPYAPLFRRHTSRDSMERYLTGLLTDLPYKTADTIAAAVAGTSTERLQRLLTDAAWDARSLDEVLSMPGSARNCSGLNRALSGDSWVELYNRSLLDGRLGRPTWSSCFHQESFTYTLVQASASLSTGVPPKGCSPGTQGTSCIRSACAASTLAAFRSRS
jgi:hypothetical protein